MSDAAQKNARKPAKPAEHPKYSEMVKAALASLKERNGSSRQAIQKYIVANYKVGDSCKTHLKIALRRQVVKNVIIHTKGKGASGSFKLNKEVKEPKIKKKIAAKKPAAKKVAVKKPVAKKSKAKTPKKAVAKKAVAEKPKKAVSKKAAAKPKPAARKPLKKSPAKKPAAKKPAAANKVSKKAKPAKKPARKAPKSPKK